MSLDKRDYCDLRSSRFQLAERKWQFKTKFRAGAYSWRGSRLAISRLKEAFSEIKAAAKSDPVAAGDGAVCRLAFWRRWCRNRISALFLP
jgi:hypothetical protein